MYRLKLLPTLVRGIILYNPKIMQISGSSAIASVSFGDNNSVAVKYTTNDKEYGFTAKDQNVIKTGLETTIAKGESVGRLIAGYRRNGQLQAV